MTGLTVTRGIDADALAAKDILVLGGTQLAQLGGLFSDAPVRYENGRLRVAERGGVERVFEGQSPFDRAPDQAGELLYGTDNFAGIVSFQSPFERGRTVIALLASDTVSLPLMIDGLADVKINAQVQGDLSVVNGEGMSSFAVGNGYWVGDLPLWMRIAYWFSGHPMLMAFSGLLVALLVSGPIYMILKRQERRRLAAVEKRDA